MNEPSSASPGAPAPEPPPSASPAPARPEPPPPLPPSGVPHGRWIAAGAVLLTAISVAALMMAWNTQQRLKTAEAELVRRQQDAGGQALEARTLARQAEATARDAAAKIGVLEARVAETSLQRTQIEELIQSLSRSRDENVLADVDASIRVAIQQTSITGSVEPLAAALRQADERLARYQAPRLERVRRAVAQDLDRVKAAGVVDLPTLAIRLDEAIRMVDELPLLAAVDKRSVRREPAAAAPAAPPASAAGVRAPAEGSSPSASAPAPGTAWPAWIDAGLRALFEHVWDEVRTLVRVARVDDPEAALLAPDERFFLRENLKLRLLNARLALMSRQFDTVQSDLREALGLIDRYFDRSSRRVAAANELLRQVAQQAQKITVPRPDATLAAVAAAVAGR